MITRFSCTLLLLSSAAINVSAQVRGEQIPSDQIPELNCDRFSCTYAQAGTRTNDIQPFAANPLPVGAGPSAGQRLLWRGAGYPSCQNISGSTYPNNLYSYIQALTIPVPLGSTHATLNATIETSLRGGPNGSGAIGGILQIKRSSQPESAWENAASSYAHSIAGSNPTVSLFSNASYFALEDLALLAGGTGVPSEIDVRMTVFPLSFGTFTLQTSQVCNGQLLVEF